MYSQQTAATASAQSYQIDLSAFKDTLLELNKNIYFGDNLVLTINWNPANKFTFKTVGSTSANKIVAAADTAAAPTLSTLYLYVATETDPTIISQLVSSVNNGEFSLITPFVYCQKYALGGNATSMSMQQRLNSSYGSTLLRAYFGAFHGTESNATVYTHNDTYIVDYNTYMDGLRLQDYTLRIADGTAWLTNERNFRNSSLLCLQQFKDQFVHIDNWCGASPCENDDSALNGLSLDTDRTWSIQVGTLMEELLLHIMVSNSMPFLPLKRNPLFPKVYYLWFKQLFKLFNYHIYDN